MIYELDSVQKFQTHQSIIRMVKEKKRGKLQYAWKHTLNGV